MSFFLLVHGVGMGVGGAPVPVTGNPRLSNESASAACNAVVDLLDDGYLKLYDGTQPDACDDAVTTQTLLAELRYGTPAFGAAVNGVATANAITGDASANATGTATWFRTLKSNGTSPVFDGSIGTVNENMILSSVSITAGAPVNISSHTYTHPKI